MILSEKLIRTKKMSNNSLIALSILVTVQRGLLAVDNFSTHKHQAQGV